MSWLLRLIGLEAGTDAARIVESQWLATTPLEATALYGLLAAGLLLAGLNLLPQLSLRPSVRVLTVVLRLAIVGLVLFVWQRVEWHVTLGVREPQQWTVLVDDSASMATTDVNGESRFAAARRDLAALQSRIGDEVKLTVATVSGQSLGDSPTSGPTPLAAAIRGRSALRDRLVLLTDGRDSDDRDLTPVGEDLLVRDTQLSVVLYGTTTPPADVGLTAEPDRSLIRLGEELVVQGTLSGTGSLARPTVAGGVTVVFKENGKEVKTIDVPAGSQRFEVRHRPKQKGQHVYTLELPTTDAATANNVARFTAQVVEEKINVLLVEGFPRFEFKLIKAVLEVDPLVNLVSVCQIPGGGVYVQGEPLHRNPEQGLIASQADLFKYDVILLLDVPRNLFRAGGDTTESRLRLLVEFVTKRGGGLFVGGGQDVFRAGGYEDSSLAEILPFDLSSHFSGEAQFDGLFFADMAPTAVSHPLLRLLPEPNDNRQRWNSLPKLDGTNNVGRFKPLATPLLTRTVKLKTKGDETEDRVVPVAGVISVGEGKVLGAAVNTLWRWQLQPDYDDPPLTMLLANTIRYLAPPPGRKPDRPNVAMPDGSPQVGQHLLLTTDLRDANFDPIRNAELTIQVTKPDGSTQRLLPRDLPEEPGHYAYRIPIDQPGQHQVLAKYGKFESSREFLAGAAAGEFTDLSANVDGLRRLAKAARGELITESVDAWLSRLDRRPAERLVRRELEAWNSPLVLLLFLTLIGVDCFVRKRQGLA